LLENPDTDGTFASAPLVMVQDREDVLEIRGALKKEDESRIVAIRIPAEPGTAQRVQELSRAGVEVVHLVFDMHGHEATSPNSRHMRDVLREVHGELTKDGTRDEITLIASGGIALPEHMAKAIICGADLVAVDLPLMVALECRLCGECESEHTCPVDLAGVAPDFAVRRMVNLMGAWRNQLIELLGAMGIREVRRLRGETGRSMFFEDLERETFGRLFGKRKDGR
jgi:glutamate synthase-like protein